MTDKEIVERAKTAEKRTEFRDLVGKLISSGVNSPYGIGFMEGMVEYRNSLQEEPVKIDRQVSRMADEFAEREYETNGYERQWLSKGYYHGYMDAGKGKFKEPVSEDEIEKQFKAGDVVAYVSRQPAYSGLYLLGNPNDLSIGYSNANEPYQIALRNCTVASEDERKQFMRELDSNGYKWNEDTLRIEKEEPVSDDLEEAVHEYMQHIPESEPELMDSFYTWEQMEAAFKAGAKWQKEHLSAGVDVEAMINESRKNLPRILPKEAIENILDVYKEGILDTLKVIKGEITL